MIYLKEIKSYVVMHTFNPTTQKAEAHGPVTSRLASSPYRDFQALQGWGWVGNQSIYSPTESFLVGCPSHCKTFNIVVFDEELQTAL